MNDTVEMLIDLATTILDTALHMKEIIQLKWNYWHGVMTSPREIYERRQEALKVLKRHREMYELEHGGYDEVDCGMRCKNGEKQQQQQNLPIESYYTVYPTQRLEYEWMHNITEEEESDGLSPAEDEIDIDALQKLGD